MDNGKKSGTVNSMSTTDHEDQLLQGLKNTYIASPGDSGAALRLAQYYVEHGWYNQAMDVFRDSLKENGDDYTLLLEYGNTCFKKGEYSEAGITFKKLTEVKPDRIEGWNNLGIVQIHEGDLEGSFISFTKVIGIEPENTGALLNMGNYHAGKGELDKAQACFERIVTVTPSFADAWYNLGNARLALKNYDGSIDAFEKSLKYKTDFPSALKNLGFVYEKMERLTDAEQLYLKAIEHNKADASLRSNLGAVQLQLGKADDAKECFLKAVRLAPQEMSGWMGLRQVALIKGDVQTFTRATLAVLPRLSEDLIAESIEKLYDLNQWSAADEIIKQVDRLGKTGDLLDIQRIIAYFQIEGLSGRVATIYKKLSSVQTQSVMVLKGLARFAFNSGDFESVVAFVNKIEQPDSISQRILWRSLIKLNREIQARRLLQNYIDTYPDCAECYFLLAAIEAGRGKLKRAEKLLIHSIECGFSNFEEIQQNPVLKEIFASFSNEKSVSADKQEKFHDLVVESETISGKQVIV